VTERAPDPGPGLAAVVDRLVAAGCVAADDEAAELLADAPDDVTLEERLRRRERGEPLAWLTGTIRFGGRRVRVDPGVYVPRFQTEELAHRAAALLLPGGRALDLCTGAGAVAAHLRAAVPTATVIGVDVDPLAAACARRNGVPAIVADLDAALRPRNAFDVVTAVAPYVPTRQLPLLPADVLRYEPHVALDGGDDGLELVRRVVEAAARLLRPAGRVLVEVGGNQDGLLAPTLDACGFGAVDAWRDADGDLRGIVAERR
jgi:release factor glutamine methyltransferase